MDEKNVTGAAASEPDPSDLILEYSLEGAGDGQTVLVLHGITGSRR